VQSVLFSAVLFGVSLGVFDSDTEYFVLLPASSRDSFDVRSCYSSAYSSSVLDPEHLSCFMQMRCLQHWLF
jgi:hypothetical protein